MENNNLKNKTLKGTNEYELINHLYASQQWKQSWIQRLKVIAPVQDATLIKSTFTATMLFIVFLNVLIVVQFLGGRQLRTRENTLKLISSEILVSNSVSANN